MYNACILFCPVLREYYARYCVLYWCARGCILCGIRKKNVITRNIPRCCWCCVIVDVSTVSNYFVFVCVSLPAVDIFVILEEYLRLSFKPFFEKYRTHVVCDHDADVQTLRNSWAMRYRLREFQKRRLLPQKLIKNQCLRQSKNVILCTFLPHRGRTMKVG